MFYFGVKILIFVSRRIGKFCSRQVVATLFIFLGMKCFQNIIFLPMSETDIVPIKFSDRIFFSKKYIVTPPPFKLNGLSINIGNQVSP